MPAHVAPDPREMPRIIVPRESLLSRYELIGKLGSGGMAEVFVARALGIDDFDKVVVLKRILPSKRDDPRFVGMLRDEARVAAVLDHPNIVHTYDVGIDDGGVFIAMEYIDGEDLRGLLDRVRKANETIPLPLALQIAAGAAAGLHHAHEQTDSHGNPLAIVHRDVSPANIIVTRHSTVKLIDFGIAKSGSKREQTAVGTLKGKVAHMSPEQVRGLELDRRSDVFALGTVMYELVTMVRPFVAESQIAVMHQICNEPHMPADERRPTLPEPLGRLIDRALAKDPDDRHPTAFHLLEELERITRDFNLHALPGALGRYLDDVFGPRVPPWLTPAQAAAHQSRIRAPTTQTGRRSWDLSPDGTSSAANLTDTVTSRAPKAKRTEIVTTRGPSRDSTRPPRQPPSMAAGVAIGFTLSMAAYGGVWWAWPRSDPKPDVAPTVVASSTAAAVDPPSTEARAVENPPAAPRVGTAHTPVDIAPTNPVTPAPAISDTDRETDAVQDSSPPGPEPTGTARPRTTSKKDAAAERATKAAALLDQAGRAALAGRDAEALRLVEHSLDLRRTTTGYAKLAMIACRLRDRKKAARAQAKLSGRVRADIVSACAAHGIELPD